LRPAESFGETSFETSLIAHDFAAYRIPVRNALRTVFFLRFMNRPVANALKFNRFS
jgi:hypothetical protein